jgi:hypothetical protein
MGIMFLSSRGIYLLSRSLDVSYIGKPIEDTLATYSIVTSAVLVASQNEVRFTCNNGVNGITAKYNILFDAWTYDSIYDTNTATAGAIYTTAIIVNGAYYCATAAGQVYQEMTAGAANSFMDNGTWVTFSGETANIKTSGIAGWGRLYRFFVTAEALDAHDLNIQYAFNESATYTQTNSVSGGNTFTWPNIQKFATPLEQMRSDVGQQKCQSCRVKWSDAPPTGGGNVTGQAMRMVAISAEIGTYPGTPRVGPLQRT